MLVGRADQLIYGAEEIFPQIKVLIFNFPSKGGIVTASKQLREAVKKLDFIFSGSATKRGGGKAGPLWKPFLETQEKKFKKKCGH